MLTKMASSTRQAGTISLTHNKAPMKQ